jgi:pantoate--beta-alanine ligase
MQVFDSTVALRSYLQQFRMAGGKIGLVPTMGALHDGHLSLVESALANTDLVVVSIFVNPLQFNNSDDLENYPRNLEKDIELLEKAGCHAVFSPSQDEVYGEAVPLMRLHFGHLEKVMEGKYRPGHFNGVGIIVSKLFHMVQPDVAVFGQKDYQQVLIVKELVSALGFPLEIIVAPTQRGPNGLALSSRNARLSDKARANAGIIYQLLETAATSLRNGIDVREVKKWMQQSLASSEELRLEYFEVAHANNLRPTPRYFKPGNGPWVLCIAVYLEEVRLIDNYILEE